MVVYLVCFVVVLRVVFEDFWAFLVVEGLEEVVDAAVEFFTPFFAVHEPVVRMVSRCSEKDLK